MAEHVPLSEIDVKSWTNAVAFSANGEYLVSGFGKNVRVWRVKDGKQMATMVAEDVWYLAVSKDGRWIAAGTWMGELIVWDAKTYETVLSEKGDYIINGVDFSPDEFTRLVVASNHQPCTVTVWDVATRKRLVGPLYHEGWVTAAKYSPQGDRIATADESSVRIYDSNNGRLLVSVQVKVTLHTGLLWSNDQLFVVSDGKIKQIKASTGEAVSEWPVSDINLLPRIAMPQHGGFIAYSADRTVTFWDTSTHAQLGLIQYPKVIRSIAFSPDDRLLVIGGEDEKITVHHLSRITEPDLCIDDVALDSRNHDQLANVDAVLTGAITDSPNASHHMLASRALVRARLQMWDAALDDAKKSVEIHPSVVGYIAKSVALVGKGDRHAGYRACDIALERFHSNYVTFLLLIKAVIVCMAGEHHDAISRLDDLIAALPFDSICHVVQAYMYLLFGNSRMESGDYSSAIPLFERARTQMRCHASRPLLVISFISGWKFDDLDITIRQRLCEALYAAGGAKEGGESLINMIDTFTKKNYMSAPITKWVSDFTHQCLSAPENDGNVASNAGRQHEASMFHTNLNSTTPTPLLREWAKSTLASSEWRDAMVAAVSFMLPRFTIYRAICEHLETVNRITDASECFHKMVDELAGETNTHPEQAEWILDFKRRCSGALEGIGDAAMNAERHDDAISQYSAVLSLDPVAPQGLLIKRSQAYLAKGLWEDALNDANEVIMLDPSSPWGYERKHVALHQAGKYENAIDAFETMLANMSQSSDLDVRERCRQYVNPGDTKVIIRRAVEDTIRDSPRVLINTVSGLLLNGSERVAAFESLPVFNELVSSMTTQIDYPRIEHAVGQYYRYAMFSHKWEDNEPLFDKVTRTVVYDLEGSSAHDKLRMFCKIVRDSGLHWAWSDTCCINKADHLVLQEALVAMFKWYQNSAVTIVFLRGVRSPSRRGDLTRNIWNTRAWTFQEYHASKVVRFYNDDWTLYLNLDIPNHKESSEIISEMEGVTGVSAQALMALQPGLDEIREKLCLASRRRATLVEDAAYSLLGTFSISMPIVYGEGNQALGRLLAQLLTSSGDTSILAWTGRSGHFNSCLPANITVFSRLPTTHIPPPIKFAGMDVITATLRASVSLTLAMRLYDRLNELPVPSFAGQRMKLPCLSFQLGGISASGPAFRAKADSLGIVEIRTSEDLSQLDSLILVHPWIDFLLDRHPVGVIAGTISENTNDQSSSLGDLPSRSDTSNSTSAVRQTRISRIVDRLSQPFSGRLVALRDATSLLSPSPVSLADRQMQALRLIARLRQPFGALLFTPRRQHVAEYRRVATESMITVRVREDTSLRELISSARILDVL